MYFERGAFSTNLCAPIFQKKQNQMSIKDQLKKYCELHWWNMRRKTLSFKGTLKDLIKNQGVSCRCMKTETEGIFKYCFKNKHGISFKTTGTEDDFSHYAKQFIQMELVRMGDRSQLYVSGVWRPKVTVNK